MVMLQPVSSRYIVEEFVKGIGMPGGFEKFDQAVHERTGFRLAEQSPLDHGLAPVAAARLPPARLPGVGAVLFSLSRRASPERP
jgi:hypothetical protein